MIASAPAGNIKPCQVANPDVGSARRLTAKITIKSNPNQKLGTDNAATDKRFTLRSSTDSGRAPASTPSNEPPTPANTGPTRVNSTVAGKASRTTVNAGRSCHKDWPKSPRSSEPK